MPEPWPALEDPAAKRVWREVLVPISDELRGQVAELVGTLIDQMQAALPGVMPDPETVAENRISIDQTLRSLADGIHSGIDPRAVDLPVATVAFAEAGVRRQVSAASLIRAYRLGHEAIWEWFFARIVERCGDREALAASIRLFTHWTFAYTDTAVTHVEQTVERERERWLRSTLASRGAAIAAIVSGEETDEGRAAKRLRYRLDRHHLGVSCAADTTAPDAYDAIAEAIGEAARVLDVDEPLIFPTGVTTAVGWISRARPFTEDELGGLKRLRPGAIRVALGEPAPGLEGFRRSHLESGHARRIATAAAVSGVVRYADLAVAAMASNDPDQAAAFVRRVLGPLAEDTEVSRRAAEALAVYLDENRSRTRAGELLHVHPNTVTYRVQQAEKLLGRSVDTLRLDERVALALLPVVRGTDEV